MAEGGSGAAQADAEVWDKAIGPGIDASARTHRQPARGLHRDLIECSVSDRIDVRSLGSKGILSGVVPFCALLAVEMCAEPHSPAELFGLWSLLNTCILGRPGIIASVLEAGLTDIASTQLHKSSPTEWIDKVSAPASPLK